MLAESEKRVHRLQVRTCLVRRLTRLMKRAAVLKKIAKAAKAHGLDHGTHELTRHTAVRVGRTTRTLGRHSEVDEVTAR